MTHFVTLLSGYPDRPHHGPCSSVCPSVRPVLVPNWRTRNLSTTKLAANVPRGGSNRCTNFYVRQLYRQVLLRARI